MTVVATSYDVEDFEVIEQLHRAKTNNGEQRYYIWDDEEAVWRIVMSGHSPLMFMEWHPPARFDSWMSLSSELRTLVFLCIRLAVRSIDRKLEFV